MEGMFEGFSGWRGGSKIAAELYDQDSDWIGQEEHAKALDGEAAQPELRGPERGGGAHAIHDVRDTKSAVEASLTGQSVASFHATPRSRPLSVTRLKSCRRSC
jgi:hypothetical protein